MFSIALIGFAMAYNTGFGDKIWELSTAPRAFVYLMRAFLSNVKLMPVYSITPVFGAILILLFYVTFMLVGFNFMFAMMANSLYVSKYDKDRVAREQELAELQQDEPMEEFVRTVQTSAKRSLELYLPALNERLFGKGGETEQEGSEGSEAEDRSSNHGSASGDKGGRASLRDADGDGGAWDQGELEDMSYQFSRKLPTSQELLRAIEHMSGRILSEVSIVGIEIKSELHDVCERVAQMQMAAEELSWRCEQVRMSQAALLT